MSVHYDYLFRTRHQELVREAEIARLRRVVRTDLAIRARVRPGLLGR
jgi:hypothetical protein